MEKAVILLGLLKESCESVVTVQGQRAKTTTLLVGALTISAVSLRVSLW